MLGQFPHGKVHCSIAFDVDAQRYLLVSDSFSDILGVEATHLQQNTDFLNGIIAPEAFNNIKQLTNNLTEGAHIQINYTLNTNNRQLTEHRKLITDAITRHKILISEITGIQLPEASRREQFLNSLIDSQTNFLVRIDVEGNFTYVNPQFTKTFGYAWNEIIGHHFSETTIPQEVYKCEEAFVNCLENPGKIVKLIHKKPDKRGFLHDTEWEFISIIDDNGKVVEIQGIGQDITQQLHAQEEAMRIKTSLEALINNTQDHIWSVDRERRYMYMNQSYISQITYLTGVEPKKGDYSNKHAGFTKQIIDEWNIYYQRALNGENYTVISQSADPAGGRPLYFEVNFNPIYTASGEIIGVGCFGHNITSRLKNQQDLMDQNLRLRNIASLSSHELRRPVASMLGLISIMDRENFFNPDNEAIIGHVLTVSKEIDEVVRLIVDSTFVK
ncbi:PAS domain S-box protein [Mucilaginibacter sp. CAU 1740]|uniref:PAS domain S-box protein n=1 Tax=Mucilaginibacter sp. CAU 1740 TaxID=3140365 RepID=UPI00325BAD08